MQNQQDEPLITRVPIKQIPIERPPFTPFNLPSRYRPKAIDLFPKNIPLAQTAMTAWEKIVFYSKLSVIVIKLLPLLITIQGTTMKDWKTTTTGVVKAVFFTLGIFGVSTGAVTETVVLGAAYALVDLVQSFFTADKSK